MPVVGRQGQNQPAPALSIGIEQEGSTYRWALALQYFLCALFYAACSQVKAEVTDEYISRILSHGVTNPGLIKSIHGRPYTYF